MQPAPELVTAIPRRPRVQYLKLDVGILSPVRDVIYHATTRAKDDKKEEEIITFSEINTDNCLTGH